MNMPTSKVDSNCEDERCERSYKQSLKLLTPGAVFILGEFERLIG